VLALGNFPPGHPTVANADFYASDHYHGNPWAPNLMSKLLETRACLLIGCGLTMVDWVIALNAAGYQGCIHAISRRGIWPQTHAQVAPTVSNIDAPTPPVTARAWLRVLRHQIRDTGADWRAVLDALRPVSQRLWQHLPLTEQRRFLRHLHPFWDGHRHRLAPVIAGQLAALLHTGQLNRHVGRIQDYRTADTAVEVLIHPRGRGQTYSLSVDAVANCSGAESDYRQLESPLIRNLLSQGLLRPDPLRLGLEVAADGALLGEDGRPSARLYTLGPPVKGKRWETTAVPEIRMQAERLAATLLS
jgi:uncharacterized NAD(P)/FAD-binding protein YdhS